MNANNSKKVGNHFFDSITKANGSPASGKLRKRNICVECRAYSTRECLWKWSNTYRCNAMECTKYRICEVKWTSVMKCNIAGNILRFVVFTRTNLFCTQYSLTFWRKSFIKWKVRHFLKDVASTISTSYFA